MNNQEIFGNNYERSVYLKGEQLEPRIIARYDFAKDNLFGNKVLEIGCSAGYGASVLPKDICYTGIDYNAPIIEIATREFGDGNHTFIHTKVQDFDLGFYDTIIAFEFLEHVDFGVALAQVLKQHCSNLICSVPYNEPKGFWGEHHVLHELTEKDFPDFDYSYISFDGELLDQPIAFDGTNLMLMKWRCK